MNSCVLPQLPADARLDQLPLQDAQVSPHWLGRSLLHLFDQRPTLPGVLVVEQQKVLGLISRRHFHQHLSHRDRSDLYLDNPLSTFLEHYPDDVQFLQLPESTAILTAVKQGLQRPATLVFEPLVVTFQHPQLTHFQCHFLVDFQLLLVAQSQILAAANTELETKQRQLKHDQHKAKNYVTFLERQQVSMLNRNQHLELQHQNKQRQAQKTERINQHFFHIGRSLSLEGKKAVQATFAGVSSIYQNTNQIAETSTALKTELEAIRAAGQQIREVSRQVRHLSVQAGIIAHQAGIEFSSFSHIAARISQLTAQSAEAGQRVGTAASRFEVQIAGLSEAAQVGTRVARSLIGEIESAGIALNHLEDLIQQEDQAAEFSPVSTLPVTLPAPMPTTLPGTVATAGEMQGLMKRLAIAEATLSDLRQSIHAKVEGNWLDTVEPAALNLPARQKLLQKLHDQPQKLQQPFFASR